MQMCTINPTFTANSLHMNEPHANVRHLNQMQKKFNKMLVQFCIFCYTHMYVYYNEEGVLLELVEEGLKSIFFNS